MRSRFVAPLFGLLLSCCYSFAAEAKVRRIDGKVGILSLGVSQFGIGLIEIEARKEKLARRLNVGSDRLAEFLAEHPKKRKKLLKSRPILVVRGPKGQLVMIDHHHWLTLLFQLGIKEVYFTEYLPGEFANLADDREFYAALKERDLVYNYDEDGNELDLMLLANMTIADLRDFNWRGLVGLVREARGIEKVDTPFFEYRWWVKPLKEWYLRTYPEPDFARAADRSLAVARGLEFAQSPEARKLPGSKANCDDFLQGDVG